MPMYKLLTTVQDRQYVSSHSNIFMNSTFSIENRQSFEYALKSFY